MKLNHDDHPQPTNRVPNGWKLRRLGDHVTFLRNGTNSRAELIPEGAVKYLHYGDIHASTRAMLDPANLPALSEAKARTLDRLRDGDLVFADASEDLAGVSKSVELHDVGEVEVVAGLHTIVARFDKSILADGFKGYLQFYPPFAGQLRRLAAGTKVYATNRKHIASIEMFLPSIEEQEIIAAALSDLDALLDGLEHLITKKRNLKQAAMQQLLTGKTRLPGFSGEWEEKRLGDLAEMGSGGTPTTSVPAYYNGAIPWVSIADMTKAGKIIMATERNLTRTGFANCAAQMFPVGTVLYAMYASLGECSITGVALCSSQAILGIRTSSDLRSEFLYYYLTWLKPVVKSLGQQGTQANLNKGMVQDFHLQLPPFHEQSAIATVLSDMDAEIEALEQRRTKTADLKQAMMQELLTGKTRLVPLEGTDA